MTKFCGMTLTEARQCAIAAAKGELKAAGIDPVYADVRLYQEAIDAVAWRQDSLPVADRTIAARWWLEVAEVNASQMKDFATEIHKWQKDWKRMMGLPAKRPVA